MLLGGYQTKLLDDINIGVASLSHLSSLEGRIILSHSKSFVGLLSYQYNLEFYILNCLENLI